jgi:hypothetical protein
MTCKAQPSSSSRVARLVIGNCMVVDRTKVYQISYYRSRPALSNLNLCKLPRCLASCMVKKIRGPCLTQEYKVACTPTPPTQSHLQTVTLQPLDRNYHIKINMFKSTLVALALIGAACTQQTTTNLFLVGFDPQSIIGSIVTSVSSDVSVKEIAMLMCK